MKTHPDHGQDVPMATTLDHLADSDSPLASRAPELTARFAEGTVSSLLAAVANDYDRCCEPEGRV
jgi:hypothetical protein